MISFKSVVRYLALFFHAMLAIGYRFKNILSNLDQNYLRIN